MLTKFFEIHNKNDDKSPNNKYSPKNSLPVSKQRDWLWFHAQILYKFKLQRSGRTEVFFFILPTRILSTPFMCGKRWTENLCNVFLFISIKTQRKTPRETVECHFSETIASRERGAHLNFFFSIFKSSTIHDWEDSDYGENLDSSEGEY